MKRRNLFVMIGAGIFMFTGCNLLPVEEELRAAPVVSTYKVEEYNYILVERGDIQQKEVISCSYQPTQMESLSFSVGDEYYGTVYVEVGDEVKKGDLLAELEMKEITDAITENENSIAKLMLKIQFLNNMISIERNRLIINEEDAAVTQAIRGYEVQRKHSDNALYIVREHLKENLMHKEQRQIFASMDGIVSKVKSVKKGDKSKKGHEFIQLSNDSLSFNASVNEPEFFPIGEKIDIVVGEDTIVTSVVDVKREGDTYSIVFAVEEASLNLAQGSRGTYTLVHKERKDVLYLPVNAVVDSSNGSIVYGLDAKGFKTIKSVELGLLADGKYEILSGLAEGEKVILD